MPAYLQVDLFLKERHKFQSVYDFFMNLFKITVYMALLKQ